MKSLSLMSSKLTPNRTNELWAGQKESELKYCYKHERFYIAGIGCLSCDMKNQKILNLPHEEHNDIALHECPFCKEKSLFWIEKIQAYECMNSRCRMSYTQVQYDELLQCEHSWITKYDGNKINTCVCKHCGTTKLSMIVPAFPSIGVDEYSVQFLFPCKVA